VTRPLTEYVANPTPRLSRRRRGPLDPGRAARAAATRALRGLMRVVSR
jgi:hypothetical protein